MAQLLSFCKAYARAILPVAIDSVDEQLTRMQASGGADLKKVGPLLVGSSLQSPNCTWSRLSSGSGYARHVRIVSPVRHIPGLSTARRVGKSHGIQTTMHICPDKQGRPSTCMCQPYQALINFLLIL